MRDQPMRRHECDHPAHVITYGHAFVQNLRRGQYELGIDARTHLRIATTFTELAGVI